VGLLGPIQAWFARLFGRRRGAGLSSPGAIAGARPRSGAARAVAPPAPDPGAFVKLAERYLGMNMADTALHICQRGLQAHPDHEIGQMLLVRIYAAKHMVREARAVIAALRQRKGDTPEIRALEEVLADPPAAPTPGRARVPAAAPAVAESVGQELQALDAYLGRLRRELARLGAG
jgi:hypothetical protein